MLWASGQAVWYVAGHCEEARHSSASRWHGQSPTPRHRQQELLQVPHVAVPEQVQAAAAPGRQPRPVDDGRVVQRVREDVAPAAAG